MKTCCLLTFGTSGVSSKTGQAWKGKLSVSGSPSPVGVVEVICIAHNAERVVEVVLNNTPSSSIR